MNFTGESINLIIKVCGNACNINCSYCYEKQKNIKGKGVISPELLHSTLTSNPKIVSVMFHGGEPLLAGKAHFRLLLDVIKEYKQQLSSIRIQTNAVLLDAEWASILFEEYAELDIKLSFSLDGTIEMNRFRIGVDGKNVYQCVLDAYALSKKYGKSVGMISVVNKYSISSTLQYLDLLTSIDNLSFAKMIPLLYNRESGLKSTEYACFLIELFNQYVNRKLYRKFYLEPFRSIMQKINGKKSFYCNYSNSKCFKFVTLYPDKKICPCDTLDGNLFTICGDGNASSDVIVKSEEVFRNNPAISFLIGQCHQCDILDFCTGGCIAERYSQYDDNELLSDYCASRRMLYDYANGLKGRLL